MQNRHLSILMICLTLLCSGIPPVSSVSAEGNSVTIGVDAVNIRQGPGLSYPIVAKAARGESYPLVSADGEWFQISFPNGKKGWVADWLVIKKKSASSQVANNQPSEKAVIAADGLRIRKGPGTGYQVIGSLSKGQTVEVYSQSNGWIEIRFSGKPAWISREFVQMKNGNSPAKEPQKTAGTAKTGVIGTVTAGSLNVRSTGSLNGKIIGSVFKGEKYQIIEEKNNWAKIEYKSGATGWVASWFLDQTKPKNPAPSSQKVTNSTVTILHNGTNIRKGPNLTAAVVQRANSGDTFQVVSLNNDWYEVRLKNGAPAYVAGWIVSLQGSAPQVTKPGAEAYTKNKIVVIDPGHGGRDNGTTGVRGTLEKDLTMRTAKLLSDRLRASGAKVTLTRTDDSYIPLRSRTSVAHHNSADAFISLHYDSIYDRTTRGMTSYYYHKRQQPLAKAVHSSVIEQTRLKDRGVRFGDYHVIRENNQNAVLLELGYLSNPGEEMHVNSSQYQEAVTSGIFQGLARYFKGT